MVRRRRAQSRVRRGPDNNRGVKPGNAGVFFSELGKVRCAAWSKLSQAIWSAEIQSHAVFLVTFDDLKSLDEVQERCFAFDALFRFLVGYPGRPPKFNIWLDQDRDIGDGRTIKVAGDLEIFGQDWIDDSPPVLDECLHRCGEGGAGVVSVLQAFLPRCAKC